MTVHINDILEEYNKLHDSSYVDSIKTIGISRYDYQLSKQSKPTDLSFSRNRALILAIVMLKRTEVDNLLDGIYGCITSPFTEYAKEQNLFKNPPKYMRYDYVKDYLDYSLITGITKDTTKKSLNMFNKQIVDKLFEANGIQKRTIAKKGNKPLVIDQLNAFTLVMFKEAFQSNSLALTELKRVIKDTGSYRTSHTFDKAWSNAVFNAIKPSKAAYRYIYNNTSDTDAEIFNHIIVIGEKSFDTPVGNHVRYCETERTVITSAMDLSDIDNHELTKAAIEAPTNSPIYNHIVDNLQDTKSDLLAYIANLTAIMNKLNC